MLPAGSLLDRIRLVVVSAIVAARRAWSFGTRLGAKRVQFRVCRLRGKVPVVTYATWRTSSTAVHHAIRASGRGPAVKAHSLHRPNVSHRPAAGFWSADARRDAHVGDWVVSRSILDRGRKADWVVLVRDPLAMAMSRLAMQLGGEIPALAAGGDPEALLRTVPLRELIDRLLASAPIGALDRWFAEDMLPALGWTPFEQPFDRDRGWIRTECPHGRVLVLRADVPDADKSSALSAFLGTRVEVKPKNGSGAHGRGGVLGALAERLARHPDILSASLALRTSRHFWHEAQLRVLRDRWIPSPA